MSLAAEAAARIKNTQDDIATSQRNASERREVAVNNFDPLCRELTTVLEKHAIDFASELPQAKESGLGTLRVGFQMFKITTKAYPLLTLTLNFERPSLRIIWTSSEQISAMAPNRTLQGMIGLAVDRDLQPCFTDGERLLAPSVLADDLMGMVFDFFARAIRVRSLLA